MGKHELLVPAGNMECLKQAVHNGCDAVYVGCKNFGARKFAANFTNDEIIEAIKYCHLYGVRLYVTMNTLVKNNEVSLFLEQAAFLHKNGVDALILQDFGMICLLRNKYPNLEIHVSTQANISSKDVCEMYYNLGVKRVVFSRELSIDEIDGIDVLIEKEAFIHGALCISYSGCCLMSAMLGGRSGNRGECVGCCRMPYSLEQGGKLIKDGYLLSTKELNTTSKIERLKSSSIYSFKIEGRMKSPLYVGFITNLYRRLIDGENVDLDKEISKLKTIFNRGFTLGRIFNVSDEELLNIKAPNHLGFPIGKVIAVNNDKIKIKLFDNCIINQHDSIRFLNSNKGFVVNYLYNNKMNLVSSSDNICYVDNKVGLTINDVVSKTHDILLEKEFTIKSRKKVPITFSIKARLNDLLQITISDGNFSFSKSVDVIEKARNAPTTKNSIIKQLGKLGNTPFICKNYVIEIDDDIFIQINNLNVIRRELVAELIEARENDKEEFIENEVEFSFDDGCQLEKNALISCFVYNKEQVEACLSMGIERIYLNNSTLYQEYKNNPYVYLVIDRCFFDIKSNLKEKNLVSDYANYIDYDVCGNYSLNVTNIYTAYYLKQLGLKSVTLSVELTEEEILFFIKLYRELFGIYNFEILGYGRVENMIIKGNILNLNVNSYNYNLIDFKNRRFPVYYDGKITHILDCWERDISVNRFKESCCIRLDFYNEDVLTIKKIVKKYK